MSTVLPALGGATMSPLCPLPIGAIRSMSLVARSRLLPSREILSYGNTGVSREKSFRLIAAPGSSPFTVFTYRSAPKRSPSFGSRVIPFILSPVLRLNLLICVCETYMSFSLVRKLENLKKPNPPSAISSIPSTCGRS